MSVNMVVLPCQSSFLSPLHVSTTFWRLDYHFARAPRPLIHQRGPSNRVVRQLLRCPCWSPHPFLTGLGSSHLPLPSEYSHLVSGCSPKGLLLHTTASSFEEFTDRIDSKNGNSTGDRRGYSTNSSTNGLRYYCRAYCCLATIREDHQIPVSWKWKWLVPTPKNDSLYIEDVCRIILMQVLPNRWTRLIV